MTAVFYACGALGFAFGLLLAFPKKERQGKNEAGDDGDASRNPQVESGRFEQPKSERKGKKEQGYGRTICADPLHAFRLRLQLKVVNAPFDRPVERSRR